MSASRKNNFYFLRLTAAVLVWYSHSYAIMGLATPLMLGLSFYDCGRFGVAVFFIISGYFIAQSYERHDQLKAFLRNRVLRLVPALYGVVLLTVFILGPIATSLSLHEYFTASKTWQYLACLLLFPMQGYLPGVFEQNPLHWINSSLWTIPYEISCYLAIAGLGALGLLRKSTVALWCVACAVVIIYAALAHEGMHTILDSSSGMNMYHVFHLGFLFAGGSCMYMFREYFKRSTRLLLLSAALILASLFSYGAFGNFLFDFALVYLVITFGFLHLPLLARLEAAGDYSYGIYLYAFPIQQLTRHFMSGNVSLANFMTVSLLATLACAFASWHLVEKRALRLKR